MSRELENLSEVFNSLRHCRGFPSGVSTPRTNHPDDTEDGGRFRRARILIEGWTFLRSHRHRFQGSEGAKNGRFHSVFHWQIYGWTIGNAEAGPHDRVAGVRAVPATPIPTGQTGQRRWRFRSLIVWFQWQTYPCRRDTKHQPSR